MKKRTIHSIGHSNRDIKHFIAILKSFDIKILADIRSIPASTYCPQFNRLALMQALRLEGIRYVHMPELGGRRTGGFKSYMETKEFRDAVSFMEEVASAQRVAFMCAEANWQQCHRSLISGHLYKNGWAVEHIKDIGHSEAHMEMIKQGNLFV